MGTQMTMMTVVQYIGIVIPLLGIILIMRSNGGQNCTRILLATVGCLVLNMGYLMVIKSGTEAGIINAYKMEFLGNVLFYSFFIYFLLYYLHFKTKFLSLLSIIWVLLEMSSTVILWITKLRNVIFGGLKIKSLGKDAPTYMHIIAGPLYKWRTAVIIILFVLTLTLTAVRMYKAKAKHVRANYAMVGMAQLMTILSLVGTLIWEPDFDIVPIFASCSMYVIIKCIVRDQFHDTLEESNEYILSHSSNAYVILDENLSLLRFNKCAQEVFPELADAKLEKKAPESIVDIMEYSDSDDVRLGNRVFEKTTTTFEHHHEICGYGIKLEDVTERRELMKTVEIEKDNAEAANRAKSNFLSNMSHEIRTPMNAIVGMTDILLRENNDERTRQYLNNIKVSGDALLTIINDILDFSKIESGKMEIVTANYEPMSIFQDLSMLFQNRIGPKNIELLYEIDKNMPAKLCGDSQRIRQIIINFVNNAIKFTESGYVKLKVSYIGRGGVRGRFRFEITDTGIGIKESDINSLFGMYQQVDTRKNHAKEGTGLGLSICKQLVELMEGEVGVESEYGKGSTFWFEIPQIIVQDERAAKISDTDNRKILVKTANESILDSMTRLADDFGVKCLTEEEAKTEKPEFIIIDSRFFPEEEWKGFIEKAEVPVCILQNPMYDNMYGMGAIVLNKPLFSLNFCQLMNHSINLTHGRVDTIKSFVAPEAHILIADDNDMNIKVARGLLEPFELKIDVAGNGKEAVKRVQSFDYDLVLMDHMMPIMDGVEATKTIRALEGDKYKNLPIIALSANATAEAKALFKKEQMDDFVAKPIRLKELCECLVRYLPENKIQYVDKDEDKAGGELRNEEYPTIEGLDVKAGIENSGSQKLFMNLLGDFYKLIEPKRVKLEKCLADEMIRDYTIEVHALKNTARMIGALELSSLFYELEQLGNASETQAIKEKHPKVMELFVSYKEILKPYAVKEDGSKRKAEKEEIAGLLTRIYDGIDSFDLDMVDEAMGKLDEIELPAQLDEMRTTLAAYIADVDMENVMDVAKKMQELL